MKGAIELDNDNTEHMELFFKYMSAQQLWSHKLKKSGAIVGFQEKNPHFFKQKSFFKNIFTKSI